MITLNLNIRNDSTGDDPETILRQMTARRNSLAEMAINPATRATVERWRDIAAQRACWRGHQICGEPFVFSNSLDTKRWWDVAKGLTKWLAATKTLHAKRMPVVRLDGARNGRG